MERNIAKTLKLKSQKSVIFYLLILKDVTSHLDKYSDDDFSSGHIYLLKITPRADESFYDNSSS